MLRFTHDDEADAVYIRLRDIPYAYGEDLDCSRRVDFGADHKPIGIELLGVSHGVNLSDLPEQAAVNRLLEEHSISVLAGQA